MRGGHGGQRQQSNTDRGEPARDPDARARLRTLSPLEAAQAASDRGVRVHTLGFGTAAGTVLEVEGYRVHTALDEATLLQVSQIGGGAYYPAQAEHDPKQVYASLTPHMAVRAETMEITSILAGASIALLLVGSLLSTTASRSIDDDPLARLLG